MAPWPCLVPPLPPPFPALVCAPQLLLGSLDPRAATQQQGPKWHLAEIASRIRSVETGINQLHHRLARSKQLLECSFHWLRTEMARSGGITGPAAPISNRTGTAAGTRPTASPAQDPAAGTTRREDHFGQASRHLADLIFWKVVGDLGGTLVKVLRKVEGSRSLVALQSTPATG
jgi:hypothetical protein